MQAITKIKLDNLQAKKATKAATSIKKDIKILFEDEWDGCIV